MANDSQILTVTAPKNASRSTEKVRIKVKNFNKVDSEIFQIHTHTQTCTHCSGWKLQRGLPGQHMMAWGAVSLVKALVTSLKAASENINKQHYSSVGRHSRKLSQWVCGGCLQLRRTYLTANLVDSEPLWATESEKVTDFIKNHLYGRMGNNSQECQPRSPVASMISEPKRGPWTYSKKNKKKKRWSST